ncbi:MAG: heavy-metal-associated domain-containing protein [Chloroflexi bacterium]|nr:heavy-metal-associated domain-containing protein [Chloroflexota bacterium]
MATINVEGMSCEHCVRRVTEAIEKLPGISNVKVDLQSGTATFDQSSPATVDDVVKSVNDAGYRGEV